jgi:hypothetical protein
MEPLTPAPLCYRPPPETVCWEPVTPAPHNPVAQSCDGLLGTPDSSTPLLLYHIVVPAWDGLLGNHDSSSPVLLSHPGTVFWELLQLPYVIVPCHLPGTCLPGNSDCSSPMLPSSDVSSRPPCFQLPSDIGAGASLGTHNSRSPLLWSRGTLLGLYFCEPLT